MGDAAAKLEGDAAGKIEQRYLTTKQAAVYTGKSVEALHTAIARGKLKPDSPGQRGRHREHRFFRETLDAYMLGTDEP